MEEIKEKAYYISITGIIRNSNSKYLICKRSPNVQNFPNKWCVPGGKVERKDLDSNSANKKANFDQWLNTFERVLEREVLEETGLKIKNIGYVSNIAFERKDGFITFVISLHAQHSAGEVVLDNESLIDYAWVNLEEAKNYDLIENIYDQLEKVDELYK